MTPFEIVEGAYVIAQAYRYFPKKTVHVVVVDPGVGTARRPILMEAAGQYFVAPDNGVLAMVYCAREAQVRLISNERLFPPAGQPDVSRPRYLRSRGRPRGGRRDAGAGGQAHRRLSAAAFEKPQRTGKRTWTGRILKIDRFGNIVTNFHSDDFPDLERRLLHGARAPAD